MSWVVEYLATFCASDSSCTTLPFSSVTRVVPPVRFVPLREPFTFRSGSSGLPEKPFSSMVMPRSAEAAGRGAGHEVRLEAHAVVGDAHRQHPLAASERDLRAR